MFMENCKLESGKILVLDNHAKVLEIADTTSVEPSSIEYYEGILCPGFINTHCHLELSHLHNLIPQHTGLLGFLPQVAVQNTATLDQKIEAAANQDEYMKSVGIVAVGDISNEAYTLEIKQKSKLYYHTFVECIAVDASKAQQRYQAQKKIFDLFAASTEAVSMTLHAAYSCCFELFNWIQENDSSGLLYSIHCLETQSESSFYNQENNALRKAMQAYISSDYSIPFNQKTILNNILPLLDNDRKTLLVHNTYLDWEAYNEANAINKNLYYCTCPNANIYIENQLPDYKVWLQNPNIVTIGTDSLASNGRLSIWSEIETLLNQKPDLSIEMLLQWATINGARFLGIDDTLGSFQVGKSPGVNLLTQKNINWNVQVIA
jgi:cytosine/adenosine deaminase-related metal-dependent hydrolase